MFEEIKIKIYIPTSGWLHLKNPIFPAEKVLSMRMIFCLKSFKKARTQSTLSFSV